MRSRSAFAATIGRSLQLRVSSFECARRLLLSFRKVSASVAFETLREKQLLAETWPLKCFSTYSKNRLLAFFRNPPIFRQLQITDEEEQQVIQLSKSQSVTIFFLLSTFLS